ncbi:gp436 family protein [Ruixingdingia sedimenti]|uniref:DUF1320 domain-containing protein n=1 Tax=Ruixingdingia sedimenti TaxID=3073604 RepID=A0ABU1FEV6_9RHOB|nr:DUF1320 domain-containing protein [Xinfangfangia sp. LG-4]MDR5655405.1 DUF1320 domain-containing protein [Xinfangfangia sp. LG-4]
MAYATLADLIERAGDAEILQIADRDRDGVPDPDVIGPALRDASDLIDGYVGARYDLPLASVPPQLRPWAVSIARYALHRNGAPDHVRRDYDDAIAALEDVVKRLIALPVAAGDAPPVAVTGQTMGLHPAQVFTPQKLKGW